MFLFCQSTGEIGSVAWAVCNLSTPLPTFLNQKWGPRPVAVIGILMVGGGLFLCTFSTKIWMIMLFYGVVQGLGLCFIQTVSTQLITSFFKGSALVRACSFCAIGETVGESIPRLSASAPILKTHPAHTAPTQAIIITTIMFRAP